MNGSHIFAVNVMLGSRSAWPRPTCSQASDDSPDAELDVRHDEQPPHAPPSQAKTAWTRVWQRVSGLLD
jgi:hypothetical protein